MRIAPLDKDVSCPGGRAGGFAGGGLGDTADVKFVLGLLSNTKVRIVIAVLVLIVGWRIVGKGVSLFRSVNTASFSTATISLSLDSSAGSEAYTSLDLTHLLPGADLYLGLTVRDAGGSDLTYGMVTTATGDGTLDKDLVVGVAAVSGPCDAGAYPAGTTLYAEQRGLDSATITGRELASGNSDDLCFHLRLPSSSAIGMKSASATFDFTAQRA